MKHSESLPTSAAVVTDNAVDTSKSPKQLAAETTETIEIVISLNKLQFEAVISHKLRDVLPFVPAIKRESVIQSKVNEMIEKYFDSTYKSILSQAALKMAKATHPELFRAGK